jgi:hypothetical protein
MLQAPGVPYPRVAVLSQATQAPGQPEQQKAEDQRVDAVPVPTSCGKKNRPSISSCVDPSTSSCVDPSTSSCVHPSTS